MWLILVTLWINNGSSFLAIKVAIDTIPPMLSAGIRFTISGAALFAVYYFFSNWEASSNNNNSNNYSHRQHVSHHARERIGKRQWRDAIILGATLFLGGQGLLAWGEQYMSSGIAGLLNSTIPLWVAILALVIFRKHLTKFMGTGLAAGFGGLLLLVAPSIGNGSLNIVGTIALIVSSISWAIGSLYSSRAHLPINILASSGMLMLVGGLLLTGTSIAFGELHSLQISQISPHSLAALVYLILVNSMIAFTDFYWLLRATNSSLANTFAYVSPVIAVIFGWTILKEPITSLTVVAMSIILGGVALMVTKTGEDLKAKPKTTNQIQK
jgi:drug/metabolite transporter (DMT)-like permease